MPLSTFMGLETTLRGILAQQLAIDVTGHNIARLYWLNGLGFSRASISSSSMLRLDLSLAVMRLRR